MELLRRVVCFGASIEDMKIIYFLFVRSHLEQSATVWHSSLTEENAADLERVHKSAVKKMLGDNYTITKTIKVKFITGCGKSSRQEKTSLPKLC